RLPCRAHRLHHAHAGRPEGTRRGSWHSVRHHPDRRHVRPVFQRGRRHRHLRRRDGQRRRALQALLPSDAGRWRVPGAERVRGGFHLHRPWRNRAEDHPGRRRARLCPAGINPVPELLQATLLTLAASAGVIRLGIARRGYGEPYQPALFCVQLAFALAAGTGACAMAQLAFGFDTLEARRWLLQATLLLGFPLIGTVALTLARHWTWSRP